jgi:hypothetical protein
VRDQFGIGVERIIEVAGGSLESARPRARGVVARLLVSRDEQRPKIDDAIDLQPLEAAVDVADEVF